MIQGPVGCSAVSLASRVCRVPRRPSRSELLFVLNGVGSAGWRSAPIRTRGNPTVYVRIRIASPGIPLKKTAPEVPAPARDLPLASDKPFILSDGNGRLMCDDQDRCCCRSTVVLVAEFQPLWS
jgi:hypothetical protein